MAQQVSGEATESVSHTFDVLSRETQTVFASGPAGDTTLSATYTVPDLVATATWQAFDTGQTMTNEYATTTQHLFSTTGLGQAWRFVTGVDGAFLGWRGYMGANSREYDNTGKLTGVRLQAGDTADKGNKLTAIGSVALTYDDHDRISQAASTLGTTTATDGYGYDRLGRLIAWTRAGSDVATETYAYDPSGNMTQRTGATGTVDIAYDAADHLTTMTAGSTVTTYTYDVFGRITGRSGDASATYGWNHLGQLTAVTTSGTAASYAYGVSGMRGAKIVTTISGTTTVESVWDGGTLLAERATDASGTQTLFEYLYGADGSPLQLRTVTGSTTCDYAYVIDHGGSVIGLTDTSGTVVARYSYDPWGKPTSTWSSVAAGLTQPLRYRGYYWDGETGLYYLPARYYDPGLTRFLSPDPASPSAGDPASLNRYVYCQDDPVGAADPDGRQLTDIYMNGEITGPDAAQQRSAAAHLTAGWRSPKRSLARMSYLREAEAWERKMRQARRHAVLAARQASRNTFQRHHGMGDWGVAVPEGDISGQATLQYNGALAGATVDDQAPFIHPLAGVALPPTPGYAVTASPGRSKPGNYVGANVYGPFATTVGWTESADLKSGAPNVGTGLKSGLTVYAYHQF